MTVDTTAEPPPWNEPDLAVAVEAARVGGFVWDPARDEARWSTMLCRVHGLDCRVRRGPIDTLLRNVHEADFARVRRALRRAVRRPGHFEVEYRVRNEDGEVRVLHTQGDVLPEGRDQPRRLVAACWDVTEHSSAKRDLERSLSLLCATLDASADGILVVDREQRVVTFNRQFLRMWRIPPDLAKAGDDAMLAYARKQLDDPDAFTRKVRELYEHPARESKDVLHFLDGRTFERVSKPQTLRREVVGRVWSFRDVTDREKAIAARELFLATAAHEIRGPLMSIRLAVQSLREDIVPPLQRQHLLEIADREARRLARFVDELLDVGRLRADRLELSFEEVDLARLVEQQVRALRHEIDRSGSTVTVHAAARPTVRADPGRLAQIVTNLLSNALKFGEGRPVDLVVEDHEGQATLAVRDRGIGMRPEQIERIFEPFERRVSARNYGGLGLGLHIVQSLATAMDGEVRVESAPGRGSTFTLRLPTEVT